MKVITELEKMTTIKSARMEIKFCKITEQINKNETWI